MSDTLPINPPPVSREEIAARQEKRHQMLRRLDDRDSAVRQQAIHECQALPAYEICVLMNMAEQTKARTLSRPYKYVLNSLLIMIFIGCLIFAVLDVSRDPTKSVTDILFGVFIVVMSLYMRQSQIAVYTHRAKGSIVEIVRGAQDPAFLPEAIRGMYAWGHSAQGLTPLGEACYDNTAHWLLRLNNEEIRAFAIQQQSFYRLLIPERVMKNVTLSIRLLAYLEQYGSASAMPTVKTLIGGILVYSDKQRAVKAAAQSCLAALEQRARESRLPETLLRASSAPPDAPAVLLRPADNSANDTLPAQLLRSADGGKT